MSQKIDDVLEVLVTIRKGYRADLAGSIREVRIRAIRAIANERGVTSQTIGDAYLRRLEPDIKGTPAFDRVTENWLSGKSDFLMKVLERQALDDGDRARIKKFFA
jgi:hypothetical protein